MILLGLFKTKASLAFRGTRQQKKRKLFTVMSVQTYMTFFFRYRQKAFRKSILYGSKTRQVLLRS